MGDSNSGFPLEPAPAQVGTGMSGENGMPTDVKAIVSAVVVLVALGLVYWAGSPVHAEKMVLLIAVFFVVAMWIFPEAGAKQKGAAGKS